MPSGARGLTSRFRVVLPLTALIATAAALRLYGIDWDQGRLFHPDERHIVMVTSGLALPLPPDWNLLLSVKSPLNPHFFAYGSFPFYLLKRIPHILASLCSLRTALPPL